MLIKFSFLGLCGSVLLEVMNKKFFKVITRAKALSLFTELPVMEQERIETRDSAGRILGRTIVAPCDVPHFERSTMDGFAVFADDTFEATESKTVNLSFVGDVTMGQETTLTLKTGQAISIPTGGMVPVGANAVVMIEYTEMDGKRVFIKRRVAPGENIIRRGSDIARKDVLLKAGMKIRPQDIGTLSACGIIAVDVYKKPSVAIISTGDELVPPEQEPFPGEIRGINAYTLHSMTERYGGIPVDFGITKDVFGKLKGFIRQALANSDIVVISGGSSVGTKDITLDCITALSGSHILANGLALKPGKPTILAMVNNKPVIGLPGHPVSCMVIFYLIVKPLIEKMVLRDKRIGEQNKIQARITENVSSVSGREEYIRVSLIEKNEGVWAQPIPGGSHVISSLGKSDGIARIDLESEGIEQGTLVDVFIM